MKNILDLFDDIKNKKFKVGNKCYSEKLLNDERIPELKKFLDNEYVKNGKGIKGLIKQYNLNITPPVFRHILLFLGYELHSDRIANDYLRKVRSENAKRQYKEKTGFFKEGVQESIHHGNSIKRGIQGYYWNASKEKYVWLRSSWEYIFAKWLNEKNIIWDVEVKTYKFDNTTYRPDFFIFDENGNIKCIVEIKGYWRNRVYKYELLKKQEIVDISIIYDISQYSKNVSNDIKQWKILRKLKLSE